MERKLTAILCADVHGYSRLMGQDEEAISEYNQAIELNPGDPNNHAGRGDAYAALNQLDPALSLQSGVKPIRIEVVSLDWKWLFIYPEQQVAVVDQLEIPTGVPIEFVLTSATVMNSFFVPQLGSQIYTMPGMTTQLNLQADEAGLYKGFSAQFSGDGFSDMRFEVSALPADQFARWVESAKARIAGAMPGM